MFRICDHKDTDILMEYLLKEQILNTFIIADIEIYGYDKEFQQVYMNLNKSGACTDVVLRFHNNLILSGAKETMDFNFVATLLTDDINNIMGEGELVLGFKEEMDIEGNYIEKKMYTLDNTEKLIPHSEIQIATLSDVDNIYDFIMTHEEINFLYKNKDMITNRISSGEGMHLIMKREGEIIAHTNSAAGTNVSAMVGGVSVKKEFRNIGLGKAIVSEICKYIIEDKKQPCLFSAQERDHNLFLELGFEEYKKWGTLGL